MAGLVTTVREASASVETVSASITDVSGRIGQGANRLADGMENAVGSAATVSEHVHTVAVGTEEMAASIR